MYCNYILQLCSKLLLGHWPYSVYLYIYTWPLAINFADMPIHILSFEFWYYSSILIVTTTYTATVVLYSCSDYVVGVINIRTEQNINFIWKDLYIYTSSYKTFNTTIYTDTLIILLLFIVLMYSVPLLTDTVL